MKILNLAKEKFTKCDSGETLNWLMHPFLFITLFLSIGFLFFGDTLSIQSVVLYAESAKIDGAVSTWGVIGLITMALHTAGFIIRGKIGVRMMQIALFGGFYLWLWAGIIYFLGGFWFQLIVFCMPNIWFWTWYWWQWIKRNRGDRVAFV